MLNGMTRCLVSAILVLAVVSCGGGGGGTGSDNGSSSSGSSNVAPRFTSPTSFTFNENTEVSFWLTVVDPDSETLTVTDDKNGDGALFKVTVNPDGALVEVNRDNKAFDYENPEDVNKDNVYEQNITLFDGENTVRTTIKAIIRNVDEAPIFISPTVSASSAAVLQLEENYTGPLFTFVASDPEGADIRYAISERHRSGASGDDGVLQGAFSLDSSTGILTVNTPFDLEAEDGDEPIVLVLEVSDGSLASGLTVLIQITDVPNSVLEGAHITGLGSGYAKSVGDIDGDGVDELWINYGVNSVGVYTTSGYTSGGAFLIWGKTLRDELADGEATLDASDLTATKAIRFSALAQDGSSRSTDHIIAVPSGDVDGDGTPDLLVGFLDKRARGQVGTEVEGPVAAVVFGDSLVDYSEPSYNLLSPPALAQVSLSGTPRREALNLSIGSGDFDGDGRSDIVLASGETTSGWMVFAPAVSAARAIGQLDLSLAAPGEALQLRDAMQEARNGYGSVAIKVAGLPDITADGRDELVISGIGYIEATELDPETGIDMPIGYPAAIRVVSGVLVNDAKTAGASQIDFSDAALDAGIVTLTGVRLKIADLIAGGDIDADGVPDIALGHQGSWYTQRVATVIFGSTLRAALLAGEDSTLDIVDPADGVLISLMDQTVTHGEFTPMTLAFIPNFTDGPGDELMVGFEADGPPELPYAGSVLILKDSAMAGAAAANVSLSNDSISPALARKFEGFAASGRVGAYVIASDMDGDGIPDMSFSSSDDYYLLPGTVVQEVFGADSPTYDMGTSLAVEISDN